VTAGTLSGVLASGPQTGITQVGTLKWLTVTNSINAANITVSGTVTAGVLSGVLSAGAWQALQVSASYLTYQ
jgi:hypothetical protein